MWGETSFALKGLLEGVTGVGHVHRGDLHVRDRDRLHELFKVATSVPGRRDPLKGWRVIRESVAERWYSNTHAVATERWILRALQGLARRDDSETDFQAMLDRAWLAVRDDAVDVVRAASPSGVRVVSVEAQATNGIGYTEYTDINCHYAEIRLEVVEHIETVAATQPAHVSSAAITREGYADAAEQISAYIETLSESVRGIVHRERPWVTTESERDTKLMVDSPTDPNKRAVRTWKVYRQRDVERRGLGNLVDSDATWKLAGHRSWKDAASSYDAFQRHLDALRVVLRGLGSVGNAANPTLVRSSPLQLPEIGARMYCNILCHFADGEVNVKERTHAARVA